MTTTTTNIDKLRRVTAGEYENERWYVKRQADDDSADGPAFHPITGHAYTPAPHFAWFVWNKQSGDFHDAYETLREARAFAERAR